MNASAIQPWWVLIIRGIAAIAFGLLAFLLPGITLFALVALYGAYALLGGAVSVFGAVANAREKGEWGLLILLGVVGLGAGAIAFLHPGLTALILVLLIAAHAIVVGVLDIISAARARGAIGGRLLLGLAGLASGIFGVLVFLYPGAGALALVWLISAYALVAGALLIGAAFGLRDRPRNAYTGPERRARRDRRVSHA